MPNVERKQNCVCWGGGCSQGRWGTINPVIRVWILRPRDRSLGPEPKQGKKLELRPLCKTKMLRLLSKRGLQKTKQNETHKEMQRLAQGSNRKFSPGLGHGFEQRHSPLRNHHHSECFIWMWGWHTLQVVPKPPTQVPHANLVPSCWILGVSTTNQQKHPGEKQNPV